jgi:hypothetical protein
LVALWSFGYNCSWCIWGPIFSVFMHLTIPGGCFCDLLDFHVDW